RLDRVEAMPVGALAAREEEIDRRRGRAAALDAAGVAKRLAEMSALRMRLEIEQPDDVGGGEHGVRTCSAAPAPRRPPARAACRRARLRPRRPARRRAETRSPASPRRSWSGSWPVRPRPGASPPRRAPADPCCRARW